MKAHARAGIDIYGRNLRYAEVERYGSRYRLLKLGSCDFEFDVVEEVLANPEATGVGAVSEALQDVFAGSIAASLHIAVHPPGCYSFFSPLPAGADTAERKGRIQQEAAILAGTDELLHLTADAVRSQQIEQGDQIDTVDWVHVLAIEDLVQNRIGEIVEHLPQPRRRMMVSMHAAAATIGRMRLLDWEPSDRGPYSVAIGWYPDHVEYVVCRENRWHFSKYTDAVSPIDAAYFILEALDRFSIHPHEVEQVFLYGNDADPSSFSDLETAFELPVRRLNPLSVLDLDPDSLSPDFAAEAYVGCIGATF